MLGGVLYYSKSEINNNWCNPRFTTEKDRSLWGLYNASTNYTTHGLGEREGRFKLSFNLTQTLGSEFVSLANKPSVLNAIIGVN